MSPDLDRDRKELLVTISVATMVNDRNSERLLLVRNTGTQKWGLPAGGLKWLDREDRMETSVEALKRELMEETGLKEGGFNFQEKPYVINLSSGSKNRIGLIYEGNLLYDEYDRVVSNEGKLISRPSNKQETDDARFFGEKELLELLKNDLIYKPEFNRGLTIWWIRNQHRDRWDPYRGVNPLDEDKILDELTIVRLGALDLDNIYLSLP